MVCSSEHDGADNWKPTQDSLEDIQKCIRKEKWLIKRVFSPILKRMVSFSSFTFSVISFSALTQNLFIQNEQNMSYLF